MNTCDRCKREYLESYEECPFCKASAAEELADMQPTPANRVGVARVVWVVLALLVIVACAAGSVVLSSSVPSGDQRAIQFPEDATAQEQCFIIQQAIEQSAAVREARFGDITKDPQELVPEYLQSIPTCPEQGVYMLEWKAKSPSYSCSVHGWHGGQ